MRGGRVLWALVLIFALIAAGLTAYVLTGASAQTTYYVLNTNVQARQLITADMLTAINTKRGTAPAVAETPGDLQATPTYAKYDITAGNLITTDNAGELVSLQKGLPSNYVVTSFKADPSVAAGGTLIRGDYVDLYAVNDNGTSHLFMTRVLLLSATQDLDNSTTTSSGSSAASNGGTAGSSTSTSGAAATTTATSTVPFLFTVGVTSQNAARIATASKLTNNNPIYAVLSSADEANQSSASAGSVGASSTDILGGNPTDGGAGTDSTFTNSSSSQQALIAAPVQAAVKQSVAAEDKLIKSNPKATGDNLLGALSKATGVTQTVTGSATGYIVTGSANGYQYSYNSQTKVYTPKAVGVTGADAAAAAAAADAANAASDSNTAANSQ